MRFSVETAAGAAQWGHSPRWRACPVGPAATARRPVPICSLGCDVPRAGLAIASIVADNATSAAGESDPEGEVRLVTRTLQPVRPDDCEVSAALSALVQGYLTRHSEAHLIRLHVDDAQGEGVLTVPRGGVELLARILAHMADGQGGRWSRRTPS